MTSIESAVKVAILDDYQNVALQMADWSPLAGRATITVFNDHLDEPDALAARLAPALWLWLELCVVSPASHQAACFTRSAGAAGGALPSLMR